MTYSSFGSIIFFWGKLTTHRGKIPYIGWNLQYLFILVPNINKSLIIKMGWYVTGWSTTATLESTNFVLGAKWTRPRLHQGANTKLTDIMESILKWARAPSAGGKRPSLWWWAPYTNLNCGVTPGGCATASITPENGYLGLGENVFVMKPGSAQLQPLPPQTPPVISSGIFATACHSQQTHSCSFGTED